MLLGLGAMLNVAKPAKGSSVAVFGLGAVGLAAAGARLAGASRIIGVDLNPARFEEAKKFGVTELLNPKDYDKPVQEVIAELTDGGVDRSVECTGNINAMISAFECVHDGWGVAVLLGIFFKMYMEELEVEKFITHEVPFAEINKAFELMLKGEGLRCIIRME